MQIWEQDLKRESFSSRASRAWNVLSGKSPRIPTSGNAFDRMVRHYAKRLYNMQYDAGNTGRLRSEWGTSTDVSYNELTTPRPRIIARSRESFQNDPVYRGAINTIVANTIGEGLYPKPKVLGKDGKPATEINRAIERAFWIYSKRRNWDSRQKFPFIGEGQRLALRTVLVSGDFLLNAVKAEKGSFVPVAWQTIEADRLDDSKDIFKNDLWVGKLQKETKHGISLDEYGKPIGYWFKGIDTPVRASNIIHSYLPDRCEQHIGMPAATPALAAIYDSHDLKEDFRFKSRAISKILWFLSNKNDDQPNAGDKDENDWLQINSMTQMRGEEKPEDIRFPDNVNDTIAPLVKIINHEICSVLGTSYTSVLKDMDGVNFAAAKFIDIQEHRFYKMLRDFFNYDFNVPFYEKALEWFVLTDKIPGLSPAEFYADYDNYTEVEWVGAGKDDVDPLKDITADIEGLKNRIYTYEEVWSKRGKDAEDQFQKIQEEQERFRAAGLVPSNEPSKPKEKGAGSDERTVEDLLNRQMLTEVLQ